MGRSDAERADEAALEWVRRAVRARDAAHAALAVHESARRSRVVLLEQLARDLGGLHVDVRSYFDEAVGSLSSGFLRAAIVFSWAGFFHILAEDLFVNHNAALRRAAGNWSLKTLDELKGYGEAQVLEKANKAGRISNTDLRRYDGQLATRNQYAHPSLHKPSINEAVGFVDTMVRQAKTFL